MLYVRGGHKGLDTTECAHTHTHTHTNTQIHISPLIFSEENISKMNEKST